jgi:hypothetical protein
MNMVSRATITDQLDLYHARLERAIDGVTDSEAQHAVAAPLAPIVWQLGHLAVVDATYAQRAGGACDLPPRYTDLFKPGTGGRAEYPPLPEVWAAFDSAHRALIAAVAEADLGAPLEHPAGAYASVGAMLVYACYHRGYHAGKVATLRALLGKPLPAVPPRIGKPSAT